MKEKELNDRGMEKELNDSGKMHEGKKSRKVKTNQGRRVKNCGPG